MTLLTLLVGWGEWWLVNGTRKTEDEREGCERRCSGPEDRSTRSQVLRLKLRFRYVWKEPGVYWNRCSREGFCPERNNRTRLQMIMGGLIRSPSMVPNEWTPIRHRTHLFRFRFPKTPVSERLEFAWQCRAGWKRRSTTEEIHYRWSPLPRPGMGLNKNWKKQYPSG